MRLPKAFMQAGRVWPIVLLVAFVCIVGFVIFPPTRDILLHFINPYEIPEDTQAVQASWRNFDSGDFRSAIENSQPYLNASSTEVRADARSVYESASFYGGISSDQRIAGVDAVIADFENSKKPFFKAVAINKLLSYLMTGRDQYVFDEVFNNKLFSPYGIPDDWLGSIRKLAEYSVSLYPTVQAQEREAFWYAEQLTNYSGEYHVNTTDALQYSEKIVEIADKLDSGYDQYEKDYYRFSLGTPVHSHDSVIMDREFWKAYLYGAAAQGGRPEYLQNAKQAVDLMQKTANAATDIEGNKIAIMSRFIPEARILYAQAILKTKGQAGNDEIRQQLDRAVADIKANPSLQEGVYLAKLKNYAANPEKHPVMLQLAEIDPAYKGLLVAYGWQIGTTTPKR